jgi:hypothetical protein
MMRQQHDDARPAQVDDESRSVPVESLSFGAVSATRATSGPPQHFLISSNTIRSDSIGTGPPQLNREVTISAARSHNAAQPRVTI